MAYAVCTWPAQQAGSIHDSTSADLTSKWLLTAPVPWWAVVTNDRHVAATISLVIDQIEAKFGGANVLRRSPDDRRVVSDDDRLLVFFAFYFGLTLFVANPIRGHCIQLVEVGFFSQPKIDRPISR